MYEYAFERINIKAVKKLNTEIEQPMSSPNPNDQKQQQQLQQQQKTQHNRLSLSEFEISKIWFSFPEPPFSLKGLFNFFFNYLKHWDVPNLYPTY